MLIIRPDYCLQPVPLRLADFLRCLDATGNNMESCSFYLEQLKQCQAAASRY